MCQRIDQNDQQEERKVPYRCLKSEDEAKSQEEGHEEEGMIKKEGD